MSSCHSGCEDRCSKIPGNSKPWSEGRTGRRPVQETKVATLISVVPFHWKRPTLTKLPERTICARCCPSNESVRRRRRTDPNVPRRSWRYVKIRLDSFRLSSRGVFPSETKEYSNEERASKSGKSRFWVKYSLSYRAVLHSLAPPIQGMNAHRPCRARHKGSKRSGPACMTWETSNEIASMLSNEHEEAN